jgi:ferredoxin-NADP reductase
LAFRTELAALASAGRIRGFFTVTREDAGRSWTGRKGRIDEDLLREALPSPDARCLVCGPQQMVADVRALLLRLGVGQERILTERY